MITEPCCEHCEDGCFLKAGLIRDHIFECEQCYDARHVTITISREMATMWASVNPGDGPNNDLDWTIVNACRVTLEKDNH